MEDALKILLIVSCYYCMLLLLEYCRFFICWRWLILVCFTRFTGGAHVILSTTGGANGFAPTTAATPTSVASMAWSKSYRWLLWRRKGFFSSSSTPPSLSKTISSSKFPPSLTVHCILRSLKKLSRWPLERKQHRKFLIYGTTLPHHAVAAAIAPFLCEHCTANILAKSHEPVFDCRQCMVLLRVMEVVFLLTTSH